MLNPLIGTLDIKIRRMRASALILAASVVAACSDVDPRPAPTQTAAASAPLADKPAQPALVLPLEVDPKLAETFVRIGFGIEKGFQSTDFLTPRLRTVQAVPLIQMVKQYNAFEGERVAAAVQRLRGQVAGVEFGRDGSPVLILELPYWTHQREESQMQGTGTQISDSDNERLLHDLRRTFVDELNASEFTVKGRRVRVWWS
jgi:hypothetical protein